jgi:hypothetical protein
MEKIDFFICHASEDKDEFVRPFAHFLIKNQASVFYDEYSIRLGDSLSEKINQGLAQCKCAIVVLSKFFFTKDWTNAELQAIFQRHISKKSKLIILYHQITHEEVLDQLPLLADIYAANTSEGIPALASKIFASADFSPSLQYLSLDLTNAATDICREGFHVALRLQLNVLADPFIDKCLIECGDPEDAFGRASLYIQQNRYLVASIGDKYGRSISLRTSINFCIESPALVVAQLSISRKSFELYTEGRLVACFTEAPLDFLENVKPAASSIFFNSFDLVHPASMSLSFHSVGAEFTADQISSLNASLNTLAQSIDFAIGDAQQQDAEDGSA